MNPETPRGPGEVRAGDDAAMERLATGLGWFSIALGAAEIFAPQAVARLIGVSPTTKTVSLLRFYGMREVGAGLGILMTPRPAGWLWSRVAGDALDLGTLAAASGQYNTDNTRLGIASAAVMGVTALDVLCAQRLSQAAAGQDGDTGDIRFTQSVVVNRSPEEVYEFWRDFENLPRFMYYLDSVHRIDDRRSHWVVAGPAGKKFEWDAEITDDRPNELIAWRSVENADVENSGCVRFERAPGGRGTIVRVELNYSAPGGLMGAAVAKVLGREPEQIISQDLRRFKQVMETGEVVNSDASIHKSMHPAQPPEQLPWVVRGAPDNIEPAGA